MYELSLIKVEMNLITNKIDGYTIVNLRYNGSI